MSDLRPLAIIPVYNEADILPAVLRHLEQQGCDVYVLDNWSTDLPDDVVAQLGDRRERWPAERPSLYEWTAILRRIEEIALERGKGRWVILHDADEIRRVPGDWSSLTLADALEIAGITGYNAVHFKVRTFVPADNLWKAGDDPERHFRYFRDEHVDHGLPHVKAWFQGEERVDLHTHGGHQALFSDRHVCPHPFLLKHYPIRSQEHGERKVLKERFPRYPDAERSKRWHVQYDEYVQAAAPSFLGKPEELTKDRNSAAIVTVTRDAEAFDRCARAIEKHDGCGRRIVVALDGIVIGRRGWEVVPGVEPFDVARNLNLGIAAAGEDDVVFVRDDVQWQGPVVEELAEVAYLTSAGIVSAQVEERVDARWKYARQAIPFACVLLRRSVLDAIGKPDESFLTFERAEQEFQRRAVAHGLPVILSRCRVKLQAQPLIPAYAPAERLATGY